MNELRCKDVQTRKPHRCIWCGGRIASGEKATNFVYLMGGDFHADYYHPECFGAVARSEIGDQEIGFVPYSGMRGQAATQDDWFVW
jgi:hypothetical protein